MIAIPSPAAFAGPARRSLTIEQVVAVILVACVYFLSHPYTGIRHDAVYYAGDALARFVPGQFRHDLYFLYGSQGRFTVLPALYSQLIQWLGLGQGTIAGLLVANVLFLLAAWSLVDVLVPSRLRFFAMLSVVLGNAYYGALHIFSYGEGFLTARSFAEPAVLFGLALLLRGRLVAACAVLALAILIHPLIGAGGLLVGWLLLVERDRRWWLLAVGGAAAVALAGSLQWGPFADVFVRYDPTWLALIEEANPQALILRWAPVDFYSVVFDASVLWIVHRHCSDARLKRIALMAGLAGIGTIVATLLLVDVGHSAFIGKLQIWRALWIMHWLSMACLPLAVHALWRVDAQRRIAALLLVIGWAAPFSIVTGIVGLGAVALQWRTMRSAISETSVRLVGGLMAIVALAMIVRFEAHVVKYGVLLDEPLHSMAGQAAAMPLVLLGVAIAIWGLRTRAARIALACALTMAAGAMSLWDQRAPFTLALETHRLGDNIWAGLIEPDATVYWYRNLIAPWVLLGHGNYYTSEQGGGAVFSRDMVVELEKRRRVTAMLDFQEQLCRMMNGLNDSATSCEPDPVAVRAVCDDGKIDYIVLHNKLEKKTPLAQYEVAVRESNVEKAFYLYRCSAL